MKKIIKAVGVSALLIPVAIVGVACSSGTSTPGYPGSTTPDYGYGNGSTTPDYGYGNGSTTPGYPGSSTPGYPGSATPGYPGSTTPDYGYGNGSTTPGEVGETTTYSTTILSRKRATTASRF